MVFCVTVNTLTGDSFDVLVSEEQQVSLLRKQIAQQLSHSPSSLKLVASGKTLLDAQGLLELKPNDTILAVPVAARPQQQNPALAHLASGAASDDEDAEDRFRLPPGASPLLKRAAGLLQNRMHIPDVLLTILFQVPPRIWLYMILWILLAPVASWMGIGPLYVLATLFTIIFVNLGSRKAGEASAFSIFNPGFRELPGQLNADMLDQQVRTGNM